MKLLTTIPFAGFYGSIHADNIQYQLEDIFTDNRGNVNATLLDKVYQTINFADCYTYYAKKYVGLFAQKLDLTSLEFESLKSPKYYNFETDRIFCFISLDETQKIFNYIENIDINLLKNAIKETFTSRSGFISHYPNSLEQWPQELKDWDHNQIGTLIQVFTEHEDFEEYNLELYETAYRALDEGSTPKAERIFKINNYLIRRKERKL
jgi:hypothetical protein